MRYPWYHKGVCILDLLFLQTCQLENRDNDDFMKMNFSIIAVDDQVSVQMKILIFPQDITKKFLKNFNNGLSLHLFYVPQ